MTTEEQIVKDVLEIARIGQEIAQATSFPEGAIYRFCQAITIAGRLDPHLLEAVSESMDGYGGNGGEALRRIEMELVNDRATKGEPVRRPDDDIAF